MSIPDTKTTSTKTTSFRLLVLFVILVPSLATLSWPSPFGRLRLSLPELCQLLEAGSPLSLSWTWTFFTWMHEDRNCAPSIPLRRLSYDQGGERSGQKGPPLVWSMSWALQPPSHRCRLSIRVCFSGRLISAGDSISESVPKCRIPSSAIAQPLRLSLEAV